MTATLASVVVLLSALASGESRLASLTTGTDAEAFCYRGEGWLGKVVYGATDCNVSAPHRAYEYDGRGNRTREESFAAGATTAQVRRFAYDEADRLIAAQEWDGHVEAWKLHGDGSRAEEKAWGAGTAWPVDFAATGGA
ncbi:MAG: hypothetical protein AB1938_33130, partial [Myxococcota bacterium]